MLKRQAKLIYGDRWSRMLTSLGKEHILTRRKYSYPSTGVGSLSFLQRIFPTQESNWGLLHCRQILYQLSYEGSKALNNLPYNLPFRSVSQYLPVPLLSLEDLLPLSTITTVPSCSKGLSLPFHLPVFFFKVHIRYLPILVERKTFQ